MDAGLDWKALWTQWLKEFHDAAEKKGTSRYAVQTYARCLSSLSETADEINSIGDLRQLRNFGEKTCKKLEQKSRSHCEHLGVAYPWETVNQTNPARSRAGNSKRKYIPRYDSMAYQVLLGMREHEMRTLSNQGIGRTEISRIIKPRLLASVEGQFQKQLPSVSPALSILVNKDYLTYYNRRYFLNEEGRCVADSLLKVAGGPTDGSCIAPDGNKTGTQHDNFGVISPNSYSVEVWVSSEYKIKFLLDTREVMSKHDRSGFAEALEERGVGVEVTPLSAGDMLWVAEHKSSGRRAVLDMIVERKTLNDLVQSIIDGRFVNQKQRLERSSISHVIYLIEMTASSDLWSRHHQRIKTALSQIHTHHNFFLKQTASQNDTTLYLAHLTAELERMYEGRAMNVVIPNIQTFAKSMKLAHKELHPNFIGIDYDAFAEGVAKSGNKTVGEVFVEMLMAIRGISAEKAMAIQKLYPTPFALWQAYQCLSSEDEKMAMLFWATRDEMQRRRIRIELSEAVYQVWGKILD